MAKSEHNLKTWPYFYNQIIEGSKTFELRKNDRDYKFSDILNLREWNQHEEKYTGREFKVGVISILYGNKLTESLGIKDGYCIMSIKPLQS